MALSLIREDMKNLHSIRSVYQDWFDANKINEQLNYHWNDDNKLNKDKIFLDRLIEKKFNTYQKKLNKFHNVNLSKKQWRIIIFPWLNIVIHLLFDRWESLKKEQNYKKHNVKSFYILDETKDFKTNSFHLNKFLIDRILEFQKKKNIQLSKLRLIENKKNLIKNSNNLYYFLNFLLSFFFKSKIFIKNIGLSFKKSLILNFIVNKSPVVWLEPNYKNKSYSLQKRLELIKIKNDSKNFESFLDNFLYILFPKSYLENFDNIKNSVIKSYWPKKPKKIITAYEYKNNDIFKIWTALKISLGSRYLILQHGGNMGTARYNIEEDYQVSIADEFLSWGWTDKRKKVKRFFAINLAFKTINRNPRTNNEILFCAQRYPGLPYRVSSLPKTNQDRLKKIEEIKDFVNLMDENLKKNLTLRYLKNQDSHYSKFDTTIFENKGIKIDTGQKSFLSSIANTKIVIHQANSTGFLETLFFNIPTILILNKKIERQRKTADYYFKQFTKHKMIFFNAKDAANFLKDNFLNINEWWSQKKLQKIKRDFCNLYVRKSNQPFKTLAKKIK